MIFVLGTSEKPSDEKNSGANVRTTSSRGENAAARFAIASTSPRPIPRRLKMVFTATETISTVAASGAPISGWIT